MTQMTARYPGKCARTGAPIKPGDLIDYDRRTRRATLVQRKDVAAEQFVGIIYDIVSETVIDSSACLRLTYEEALADAQAMVDRINAEAEAYDDSCEGTSIGRVDESYCFVERRADGEREILYGPPEGPAPATTGRYISDVFRTSGGTFYRNKNGRCEDAPCCGCCTI